MSKQNHKNIGFSLETAKSIGRWAGTIWLIVSLVLYQSGYIDIGDVNRFNELVDKIEALKLVIHNETAIKEFSGEVVEAFLEQEIGSSVSMLEKPCIIVSRCGAVYYAFNQSMRDVKLLHWYTDPAKTIELTWGNMTNGGVFWTKGQTPGETWTLPSQVDSQAAKVTWISDWSLTFYTGANLNAVVVTHERVTLIGLHIKQEMTGGGWASPNRAIQASGDHAHIERCLIEDPNTYGIDITDSDWGEVTDCRIIFKSASTTSPACQMGSIVVGAGSYKHIVGNFINATMNEGDFISLWNTRHSLVSQNTVICSGVDASFDLQGVGFNHDSYNNTVSLNRIIGSSLLGPGHGFGFGHASRNNNLVGNYVENCEDALGGAWSATDVSENQVTDFYAVNFTECGVDLVTADDWSFKGGYLIGGQYGFRFDDCDNMTIEDYDIKDQSEDGINIIANTAVCLNGKIHDTTIRDVGDCGIETSYGSAHDGWTLSDIEITGAGDRGLYVYGVDDWYLENLQVYYAVNEGAIIGGGANNTIKTGVFEHNGRCGLKILDSPEGSSVDGATARSNGSLDSLHHSGIAIQNSDYGTYINLQCYDNFAGGLNIFSDSDLNWIASSRFGENARGAVAWRNGFFIDEDSDNNTITTSCTWGHNIAFEIDGATEDGTLVYFNTMSELTGYTDNGTGSKIFDNFNPVSGLWHAKSAAAPAGSR